LEIDARRPRIRQSENLLIRANRQNRIVANCDGFDAAKLRIDGDNVAVVIDLRRGRFALALQHEQRQR
jgi:hypothetical protein